MKEAVETAVKLKVCKVLTESVRTIVTDLLEYNHLTTEEGVMRFAIENGRW